MQLENTAHRVFADIQRANEDTDFAIFRARQNAIERAGRSASCSAGTQLGAELRAELRAGQGAPTIVEPMIPQLEFGTVAAQGYRAKLPESLLAEDLMQRIRGIRPALAYLSVGKKPKYALRSQDEGLLERARLVASIQHEAVEAKLAFDELSVLEAKAVAKETEDGTLQDRLTQLQDRAGATRAVCEDQARALESKDQEIKVQRELGAELEHDLAAKTGSYEATTAQAADEVDGLVDNGQRQQGQLDELHSRRCELQAKVKACDYLDTLSNRIEDAEQQLAQVDQQVEEENRLEEQKFAALDQKRLQRNATIAELQALCKSKNNLLELLDKSRRGLLEQILTLKGTIRVFVRIRKPLNADEACVLKCPKSNDWRTTVQVPKLQQRYNRTDICLREFKFDMVFGTGASNSEVFKEVSALTESAINGNKVCIFAYGQTGSGKSYTMSNRSYNKPEDKGVIMQAFSLVFAQKRGRSDLEIEVSGQFFEIYLNNVNDFFKCESRDQAVDTSAAVGNVAQAGVTTLMFNTQRDLENEFVRGLRRRRNASTNSNPNSSRSHSLMYLYVRATQVSTGEETIGVLNFIDLAGSERVQKSGVTNTQLSEAININSSLVELGGAIRKLGETGEVPPGSSELVKRLRPSLCNSRVLMIATVAPGEKDVDETIECLRFATEANKVYLAPARS